MEFPFFGKLSTPVAIFILLPEKWQRRMLLVVLWILIPMAIWWVIAFTVSGNAKQYWMAVTHQSEYNANDVLNESHDKAEKEKAAERDRMKAQCKEFAKNLKDFDLKKCD